MDFETCQLFQANANFLCWLISPLRKTNFSKLSTLFFCLFINCAHQSFLAGLEGSSGCQVLSTGWLLARPVPYPLHSLYYLSDSWTFVFFGTRKPWTCLCREHGNTERSNAYYTLHIGTFDCFRFPKLPKGSSWAAKLEASVYFRVVMIYLQIPQAC